MSYQVLARKWRPRNFKDVVGQQHVLTAFANALEHQRVHHAYLLSGTRGVGKTTIARIFAKGLNCERGISANPCCVCQTCLEIDQGRYVDLLEIDAASRTKVEDTREILDNVQYKPARARYKVYLIDEVHMLSRSSFNALLKTLEEPPEYVKFILATTDPQKLPITILSRCLQFHLKHLQPEQIAERLEFILKAEKVITEQITTPQHRGVRLLAQAGKGSMRDALSLTDQALALGDNKIDDQIIATMLGTLGKEYAPQLLTAIAQGSAQQLLDCVRHVATIGADWLYLTQTLTQVLHRVAMYQVAPATLTTDSLDYTQIQQLSTLLNPQDIQLYYQIALQGQQDLMLAPDPRCGFEMLLLRMLAFRPVSVSQYQPTEIRIPSPQLEPVHVVSTTSVSAPIISESNMTDSIVNSDMIDSNMIDSNMIDSNMIDSNMIDSNIVESTVFESVAIESGSAVAIAPKIIESIDTVIVDNSMIAPVVVQSDYDQQQLAILEDQLTQYDNDHNNDNNNELDVMLSTQGLLEPTLLVSPSPSVFIQETKNKQVEKDEVQKKEPPVAPLSQLLSARNKLRSQRQSLLAAQENNNTTQKKSVLESSELKSIVKSEFKSEVHSLHDPEIKENIELKVEGVAISALDNASEIELKRPELITETNLPDVSNNWQDILAVTADNSIRTTITINEIKEAMSYENEPSSQLSAQISKEVVAQDQWTSFIYKMQLTGLTRILAFDASIEIIDNKSSQDSVCIQLYLRKEQEHLNDVKYIDELKQKLHQLLQKPIELTVIINNNVGQTPRELCRALYQQKLQQAKLSIFSDPVVQFLQKNLAAQIDEQSIRPI